METNYYQVQAPQGWQCPVCKKVLAPFMIECPCQGQGMKTTTVTNITMPNISSDEFTTTITNNDMLKNITKK